MIAKILKALLEILIFFPLRFFITPLIFLLLLGGVAWMGWNHVQARYLAAPQGIMASLGLHPGGSGEDTPAAEAATLPPQEKGPSWFKGLLLWIGATTLLPLATFGFLRHAARKKSNRSNALVLALLGVINISLGILFLSVPGSLGISALLLLVGTGIGILYNIQIFSFAVKLEKA
jgi:hypothetical protein